MNFLNEHFFRIMQKYVNEIRDEGKQDFRTIDVIRKYIKHYHTDGTTPNESFNANIGKFLKKHSKALRIKEIASKQPITDDNGKKSVTSVWKFV